MSDIYVYFNVNFNVFFKLIKVHFLVTKLYIYQNARFNNRKNSKIALSFLFKQTSFAIYSIRTFSNVESLRAIVWPKKKGTVFSKRWSRYTNYQSYCCVHHYEHQNSVLVLALHLRPLACWDRRFESHRGYGRLSVVSVVCCQVEVSATNWSLVQRSPTDCGASLCVIY